MLRARVQYRQRRNFLAEYRKRTLQRNNAFAYGNIAVEWKSHISSHKKEEKELLLLFFMSFYQRQGSTPPSGTASQRFAPIVRRASSPLRNRGMSSGRGLPTVMDCPSRYGGNPLQRSPTSLVGNEPIAKFVRHQFQRRGSPVVSMIAMNVSTPSFAPLS